MANDSENRVSQSAALKLARAVTSCAAAIKSLDYDLRRNVAGYRSSGTTRRYVQETFDHVDEFLDDLEAKPGRNDRTR